MKKFTVITLFPQMIESFCAQGLIGQARTNSLLDIQTLNPRQFTRDAHQTVDDRAFGGGDGMVMKVEPLAAAIESLKHLAPLKVAVLTPQGSLWSQARARSWAKEEAHGVLVCGRYAGIDQRFVSLFADEQISLGDYILNGGEVAACAVIESVARLVPGVLGNEASFIKDSFTEGLLECPQFTRPREVLGLPVPAPLMSGHHARIERFEHSVALLKTALLRPDLADPSWRLAEAFKDVESLSDLELKSLGFKRSDLETLLKRSIFREQ